MLLGQRLRELEDAQRVLLIQADVQRTMLRLETTALRQRFKQVASFGGGIAGNSPWLVVGAVLGGFFMVRRWRGAARWVPAALAAWRWTRQWLGR